VSEGWWRRLKRLSTAKTQGRFCRVEAPYSDPKELTLTELAEVNLTCASMVIIKRQSTTKDEGEDEDRLMHRRWRRLACTADSPREGIFRVFLLSRCLLNLLEKLVLIPLYVYDRNRPLAPILRQKMVLSAVWCLLTAWWLIFYRIKIPGNISRIRTEHTLNNLDTEQKNEKLNKKHCIE
jgi:hypothetical protein